MTITKILLIYDVLYSVGSVPFEHTSLLAWMKRYKQRQIDRTGITFIKAIID
jgi:hypothetical protein